MSSLVALACLVRPPCAVANVPRDSHGYPGDRSVGLFATSAERIKAWRSKDADASKRE